MAQIIAMPALEWCTTEENMNLDNFLQALDSLRGQIIRVQGPGNIQDICQRFLEVRKLFYYDDFPSDTLSWNAVKNGGALLDKPTKLFPRNSGQID